MTREEALNAITAFVENYACGSDLDGLRMAIETLKKERPHGVWKYNPDCVNDEMQAEFFCSICNHGAYSRHDNFCPNCGAKMKEGESN